MGYLVVNIASTAFLKYPEPKNVPSQSGSFENLIYDKYLLHKLIWETEEKSETQRM